MMKIEIKKLKAPKAYDAKKNNLKEVESHTTVNNLLHVPQPIHTHTHQLVFIKCDRKPIRIVILFQDTDTETFKRNYFIL